jgi:hypothetical protein
MTAIGEYELAVLKAIYHAGGTVRLDNAQVDVDYKKPGDLHGAVARLCSAEFVAQEEGNYRLTDLAEEYLEILGLSPPE